MELHIFFHEQTGVNANIPEIKKIQAVSEQQLYIKRDVGGTEEIADYDLSALRTGESWKAARTENIYSYAYLIDEKGFVKIAAGIPAGQPVPAPIHQIIVPPGYPYLADGETETAETPDTTPSGLPIATSDDDLKKEIRAAAVKHARTCTDLMNANWTLTNAGQFQSDLDRWRNTRLWILSPLAIIDAILKIEQGVLGYFVGEDNADDAVLNAGEILFQNVANLAQIRISDTTKNGNVISSYFSNIDNSTILTLTDGTNTHTVNVTNIDTSQAGGLYILGQTDDADAIVSDFDDSTEVKVSSPDFVSEWTLNAAQDALAAYQALIPANAEDFATWYFAHSEDVWAAYFTKVSGNVPAYFKWTRGADVPAFASDAQSSTIWDGTGNTLDVDFDASANPEDFN